MKLNTINNKFAFILVSALSITACGGDSDDDTFYPTGETREVSENVTENINEDTDTTSQSQLSQEEISGLLFMREEEELARDLYLDLYDDKGLSVFKNISNNAETKHAEAIRILLDTYNLQDPSTGSRNTYTDPELQALYDDLLNSGIGSDDLAALRVGALVEETDIRDINTHKDNVAAEHYDIISTYDNLLCGSRNHLRAFAAQIESRTGSVYQTQVPELDDEVRAILDSDRERCGQ